MGRIHRWRDAYKSWRNNGRLARHRPLTFGFFYVMFGPVIAAEANLSQHTNNTAELPGIVESLHFHSLLVPVPRGSSARAVTDQCPLGVRTSTTPVVGSIAHPSQIALHLAMEEM